MPEDKSDWQYEHVYYCPDIDEVKYIINHSEKEQLPNTVDLRDNFSSLGIPTKAYTRSALDYTSEINMAVSMLKPQIDNLFTSNENPFLVRFRDSFKKRMRGKQYSKV